MVAYSFKKMFVPAIQSGTKCQTIRGERAKGRHARVGEPMQLYCGMRTKTCFKVIPDPEVVAVGKVQLLVTDQLVIRVAHSVTGEFLACDADDARLFAIADGFGKAGCDPLRRMHGFWLATYGKGVFGGVLIRWLPPVNGAFI